ncbi:hypothetical protein JW890_08835 [candidate division WOR-3 bacterium]|nr:hypothetical protein [candidate division WOR-3 bacterium]
MPEENSLIWSGWLAAEKPFLTVFAVAVLAAVWALSFMILPSIVVASILTFCVFVYVSEFFLPVKYGLDKDFVWKKIGPVKIQKQWVQLRSFYTDKNGILISPFTKPSRLETFRGIYIRFAGAERQTVLEAVKKHLKGQEEPI